MHPESDHGNLCFLHWVFLPDSFSELLLLIIIVIITIIKMRGRVHYLPLGFCAKVVWLIFMCLLFKALQGAS